MKILSLLFLLPGFALAQETNQSLPAGELLRANLGDFAEWKITVSIEQGKASKTDANTASPSPSPVPVQSIQFTKTKPLLRVQTSNGGKVLEDRWIVGPTQMITAPGMIFPYISSPTSDNPDIDYSRSDFPELAWISARHFAEISGSGPEKGKAIIFRRTSQRTAPDGVVTTDVEEAVVDLETRFPIRYRNGNITRTYALLPKPETALTLPQELRALLQTASANNAIINRPPGKP